MSHPAPSRNPPDEVARLVRANLGWLHAVARLLHRDPDYRAALGEDLDDYVNSGYIGLHRAAERYDPAKARFTTFATYWITQAIQNEARRSLPIHVPQYLTVRLRRGGPADRGRAIRPECLAMAERTLAAGMRRLEDAPEDPVDRRGPDPAEAAIAREMVERVRQLPEREQLILILRFGLDGDRPHTLLEIAELLELTKERVRQIEARGLARLREGLKVPAEESSQQSAFSSQQEKTFFALLTAES